MRPSIILNGALRTTGIENLFALISGALPLNPAELLSSDKMTGILQRVGEKADIVLIDTPPVLALTDASVLAQRVDGVLLYYAIINWLHSAPRTSKLISMLALAVISLSLFALISVEWAFTKLAFVPDSLYWSYAILVSDSVNPNIRAGTLLLIAPVVFSVLLLNRWSLLAMTWMKFACRLCDRFFAITLILVLTSSRAAWLAYLVVIALAISLRWLRGCWPLLYLRGRLYYLRYIHTHQADRWVAGKPDAGQPGWQA